MTIGVDFNVKSINLGDRSNSLEKNTNMDIDAKFREYFKNFSNDDFVDLHGQLQKLDLRS